jgi:cytolysin-activating lysine-acyltransferase
MDAMLSPMQRERARGRFHSDRVARDVSQPHAGDKRAAGAPDASPEPQATPNAGAGPAGAQAQASVAEQVAAQKVAVVGHAVWLMMQSPAHKHLFLTDLEWLLLPPITLNQFRIWRNKGMPAAFASWAYLDERAEARIKQNIKKLAPTDWKSGESLWLIDMVAPFGGAEAAVKELREQVFKGQKVKSLQPAPGGGVAVVEW